MLMEAVSKRIINYALRNEYIHKEQYEEYLYILTLMLNILLTDITMLIIGCSMGMVWECIVYWLIYKVLRKYCGGFHFSTSFRCYLSSCIMCPVILVIIKFVPIGVSLLTAMVMLSAFILLFLSPVEAVNKPLDEQETNLFGKVAKILVVSVTIVYVMMLLLRFYIISKVIAMSIVSVTVFSVAGKIELQFLRQKHRRSS